MKKVLLLLPLFFLIYCKKEEAPNTVTTPVDTTNVTDTIIFEEYSYCSLTNYSQDLSWPTLTLTNSQNDTTSSFVYGEEIYFNISRVNNHATDTACLIYSSPYVYFKVYSEDILLGTTMDSVVYTTQGYDTPILPLDHLSFTDRWQYIDQDWLHHHPLPVGDDYVTADRPEIMDSIPFSVIEE